MVDYMMKTTCLIDTETKKNAFRNFLKGKFEDEYAADNLKNWTLSIDAVKVPEEDTESYSSED